MRRRILLLVVGMTTLVVVAFAVPIFFLIRSTAASQAQHDTQTEASGVVAALRHSTRTTAQLTAYVQSLKDSYGRPVSITLPTGQVIGSTPGDHTTPTSRYSADFPRPDPGSFTLGMGELGDTADPAGARVQLQGVRGGQVAVTFAPGGYIVRVFLSDAARYDGENTDFLLVGGGAVVLIVISIAAGEILTRRLVRPLVESAATAQQLSLGDTSARAPVNGPAEVAGVGRALNRLADRIDQLIAEERETVADLSHRLRTPLTALRLDAEALRDPAEAERVGAHVSALERTLTAVIHAARRPQREGRLPVSDATGVVGERVRFWSALTEDQGRAGTLDVPTGPLLVRASAEDLAAAVDALLENVVAHTPEGAAFTVRLGRGAAPPASDEDGSTGSDDTGIVLEISDDGPGLPVDAPVRGRSDRGSSGLGLDIARRCAEASGGGMTLGTSPGGGARITLRLGAA